MKPKSDLVLRIASTSEVAKTQAATYVGHLTELNRLSPTTMALTLEIPNRDELAFLPGQYVNIAVPGTDESRSYSFSNAPDEKALTFLVKLTPGGVMSTYLTERAQVGDELTFTGPNGSFFLRETQRPVLLLAGGTGLAPDPVHPARDAGQAAGRARHLRSQHRPGPGRAGHAGAPRQRSGSLTWEHCVADPASSATHKGYVTSLIGPEHLYGGDVAVYLCGPPPMVEAVRKHFADAGHRTRRVLLREVRAVRDQFGRRTGRGARRAGGAHRTGARAGAPRCSGVRRDSRCASRQLERPRHRRPDHLPRKEFPLEEWLPRFRPR